MAYAPTVWVDDDGSNQVGTEFTAARMNKIEQGIAAAGTGGGGGGSAGVALRSAIGADPIGSVNLPNATWTIIPITTGLTITSSDGSPDFTRTAAGALVFNKAGTYEVMATLGNNANVHPSVGNLDVRLVVAAPGKVTPDVGDPAIAIERGTTGTEYNIDSISGTVTVPAGATLAALGFQSNAGALAAPGFGIRAFGVTLSGGVKGDKGDTGGNATVPMDTWHVLNAVGEPAFAAGWGHHSSGNFPVAFRKDPLGTVRFRGVIQNTVNYTWGSSLFTLPVGYRPPGVRLLHGKMTEPNGATTSMVELAVSPNGLVQLSAFITGMAGAGSGGAGSVILLDDVVFDTETVTAMPTGPKGDKGDTGGNAEIALPGPKQVGTAGGAVWGTGAGGWTGYTNCYHRRDPLGKVMMYGTAQATVAFGFGGANNVICTLPADCRPAVTKDMKVGVCEPDGVTWSICQARISPDGKVTITGRITGANTGGGIGSFVKLDEIDFDTDTVTTMPSGPAGPQGIQGVPGNSATVPMDPWHVFNTAGEPSLTAPWVNVAGAALRFRKDPLGRVFVEGQINGAAGGNAFQLPVGYRPTRYTIFDNLQTNGIAGTYIAMDTNGVAAITVANSSTTAYVDISFDTGLVTAMPTGPKGDKGDPGTGFFLTLNWNTALAPGFYYGGPQPYPSPNTINGPGDPLNAPNQAGIVTLNGDQVVQRVYDLDMQKGYTRYRTYDKTWTAWAPDLVKPLLLTEQPLGLPAPLDGEERYVQSPAMKTDGVMWRFRYNAGSASAYKWEFVGGADWINLNMGDNFAPGGDNWADAGAAGPSVVLPFAGDYTVEWGALFYANVAGIYAQMSISAVNIAPADGRSCMWGNIAGGYLDYGDRSKSDRFNGVGAGLMKAVYKSTPTLGGGYQKRFLRVQPIRIIM